MHDFDYNYASCTNKLINKDGGGEDYEYDASGCYPDFIFLKSF